MKINIGEIAFDDQICDRGFGLPDRLLSGSLLNLGGRRIDRQRLCHDGVHTKKNCLFHALLGLNGRVCFHGTGLC